jgi:cytidyltransferase-like protein
MNEKTLLRAVYTTGLLRGTATLDSISVALGEERATVRKGLVGASKAGLVEIGRQEVNLTAKGRARLTIVFLGGAFEIIHPGHIHTIAEAKALGDILVVTVAADPTVSKNKHRDPVTSQEWRVRLVSSLRDVDAAIPGGKTSIYDTMEKVGPDIVALGYDQWHNPKDIEDEAGKRGMKLSVVRLTTPLPGVKTSKIIGAL